MTVQAEQLSVWSKTSDDLLVEGDPILARSLFGAAPEDMIDIETTNVVEAAVEAPPTQSVDSCLPGRSVLLVPTVALVLTDLVGVLRAPLTHVLLGVGYHAFTVARGKGKRS